LVRQASRTVVASQVVAAAPAVMSMPRLCAMRAW
jgi:hypothetical protein